MQQRNLDSSLRFDTMVFEMPLSKDFVLIHPAWIFEHLKPEKACLILFITIVIFKNIYSLLFGTLFDISSH